MSGNEVGSVGNMSAIKMDIVGVTGRTLESCKFLGLVPDSLLGDEDYNVYVRWDGNKITADRSDTDRQIVAAYIGSAGKGAALIDLMERLSAYYGVRVEVQADPGVKVPAAMGKVIGKHDGTPINVPVTVAEVADVVSVVKANGRVFVTEAYNFGRPAAFGRAVELGFLLLVEHRDHGSQWVLAAQTAWDAHYVNATSEDITRADGSGPVYQASLRAFLLAWSLQFPDIPVESAHDIMVSGDNDVAYAVDRAREDMADQAVITRGEAAFDLIYGKLHDDGQPDLVADYIATVVQDMVIGGRDIATPLSFKIGYRLPCVCFIMFDWDRANIPTGGLCCPGCGSVFTMPDADISDTVAAYRRTVLAHNDYCASQPAAFDEEQAQMMGTYLPRDLSADSVRAECICWAIFEAGQSQLPDGGACCPGCGSVFTREGEEAASGILAISARIVARNGAADFTPLPMIELCGHCGRSDTLGRDDQLSPFPHECATRAEIDAVTRPVEVPVWVDNTCPRGGQHEPSYRHVIASHNGLTTGTCKCGRKVRRLDYHVRDFVTEAEMDAIGAGNHCSNGRCADCDACKLAYARFLASDPFGALVTVGGQPDSPEYRFPVAAVPAFTPSDDLGDDAEFLAQVAHENGNRVSRDHAAVAVKVKTPVRTLLNKRKRKASKVNRRKVKGGF